MNKELNNTQDMAEQDAAKAIVKLLNEETDNINSATLAKLAAARRNAVAVAAERASVGVEGGSVLRMFGDYLHQHRFVAPAAMVCSAMLVAFIATQQFTNQDVAGQGDAFLLGSDLPPEAYFDRGFDTWLASSSQQ